MDIRGGFIPRPPRDRGGLIRPAFPFRGRGVMLMDRARLGPPRPALMRGIPPFVGRGMLPPGRHRGLGPVMLPRLPPPPGALAPHLGPRGLLPRPILPPPRPLHPELIALPEPSCSISLDDEEDETVLIQESIGPIVNQANVNRLTRGGKTNRTDRMSQNATLQAAGNRKNRKDNKNRRTPVGQSIQSSPPSHTPSADHSTMQSTHPSPLKQSTHSNHQIQQPPQQNVVCMNQAPIQKYVPPMQPQMNANIPSQTSQLSIPQQSPRNPQNGMSYRNRGNTHVGRGGIPSNPPAVNMNQGHMMNHGTTNVPVHNVAPVPPRPNVMMNGPPPPQFSNAPPTNYTIPPPAMAPQMPIKRGAPPVGPPIMQPKRVRYEPPPPTNGYMPYQQQPPPQQPMYHSYDVPPPTEMYNNMPQTNVNMPLQQSYPSAPEYNNCQPVPPQPNVSYCQNVNPQYSTAYNNQTTYPTYTASGGYDQSVDYSTIASQQSNVDPYGYAKPVDSYGYANTSYAAPQQTGYEDYSGGYVDQSGYASTVQDPSYGQSVGTYPAYSY